jgi:hypothetical protein
MSIDAIMLTSPMPAAKVAQAQAAADDDGFGFDDFLDIINPLQHIPIVGTLYREITGDEIHAPARLAGGTLYGGLLGFLGAAGTYAFEGITGESVDGLLMTMFNGGETPEIERANRAYASAQALID